MKKNNYIVFSKRLAKDLMKKGYELLEQQPNKFKPQYNVYFFKDTEEIRESVKEILQTYQH